MNKNIFKALLVGMHLTFVLSSKLIDIIKNLYCLHRQMEADINHKSS